MYCAVYVQQAGGRVKEKEEEEVCVELTSSKLDDSTPAWLGCVSSGLIVTVSVTNFEPCCCNMYCR